MRKIVISLFIGVLFLVFHVNVSAQNNAYNIGDKTASLGLTLGNYGYGYLGTRSIGFPPVTLTGEYGFHEYVSVGAFLGFLNWKREYIIHHTNLSPKEEWDIKWTHNEFIISTGARASFHYLSLINENFELDIDEEYFDFYVTVIVGLEIYNFNDVSREIINVKHGIPNEVPYNDDSSTDTDLILGPIVGFKYMVTEQIGLFIETGWNALGYFTFGASARF